MTNSVPEKAVRIAAHLRASAGDDRVIMFTAGRQREGVSAVACAVASALARLQTEAVLLVDANLGAPACHERLGVSRGPGLTELLNKASALDQVVHATGVQGLSLVPAGLDRAGVAAWRTGAAFSELIRSVRSRYRYVIVDAPSLVESAEASIIAAESDAVVLVVGAGAHSRTALADLRREVQGLGTRLLGAVLAQLKD
jgi:Mrp family chromosome partitioning ATPase